MRAFALALVMALSPLAAHAGEAVPYNVVDGEVFEGYRAKPAGASKGLVVIIHAWGGVTAYEQKRADMIAALGYEAFALDLYSKGNRPTDLDAKKREAQKLYEDRARMQKLLIAGLKEARAGGDEAAVVIGYCFGGAAALELARSGKASGIKGYVTFHGGLKTPKEESYPAGTPPLLILHGGADTSSPWRTSQPCRASSKPRICRMRFRFIPARRTASPSSTCPRIAKTSTRSPGQRSPISSPRIWETSRRLFPPSASLPGLTGQSSTLRVGDN
jgi:dienelactone hydrolase